MPTIADRALTPTDKKRLSAALTKRIGPSTMPHTFGKVSDPLHPFRYRVRDPETGSRLIADLTPSFRMQVVSFSAPHQA